MTKTATIAHTDCGTVLRPDQAQAVIVLLAKSDELGASKINSSTGVKLPAQVSAAVHHPKLAGG